MESMFTKRVNLGLSSQKQLLELITDPYLRLCVWMEFSFNVVLISRFMSLICSTPLVCSFGEPADLEKISPALHVSI